MINKNFLVQKPEKYSNHIAFKNLSSNSFGLQTKKYLSKSLVYNFYKLGPKF